MTVAGARNNQAAAPPSFWNGERVVESNMNQAWRRRGVVIVAETGSDIQTAEARRLGIYLVPMHVIFGNENRLDGSFSPKIIEEHRRATGRPPSTSACSPADFEAVFRQARHEHPEKTILHLAYSAKTTTTFDNALEGASNVPGVLHVDTQAVSSGQGAIVREIARTVSEMPDTAAERIALAALTLSDKAHFGFVPGGLEYLHAGGRLSNAAFVGGSILRMRPIVEVVDGRLVATKRIQGSMRKAALSLIQRVAGHGNVDPQSIYLLRSPGLNPSVAAAAEAAVAELGCKNPVWYNTGGVISCHCGPGTIGIGCFTE